MRIENLYTLADNFSTHDSFNRTFHPIPIINQKKGFVAADQSRPGHEEFDLPFFNDHVFQ